MIFKGESIDYHRFRVSQDRCLFFAQVRSENKFLSFNCVMQMEMFDTRAVLVSVIQ